MDELFQEVEDVVVAGVETYEDDDIIKVDEKTRLIGHLIN